jgi:hypothetical protein
MATVTFDLHAEVAPREEADAGANPLENVLSSSSARAWVLLERPAAGLASPGSAQSIAGAAERMWSWWNRQTLGWFRRRA